MTEFRRVALSTGVTLNVALAGDPAKPAVILLHGFPESHRTWRGVAPLLADRFRLIMPDQRGFGASDAPQDVDSYRTSVLIGDIFALADALGTSRFALVGHDWGGAIAWGAALREDPRCARMAVINAPHPWIMQRSLIEHSGQRAASQYINAFRAPEFEAAVAAMGLETFFKKTFRNHVDLALIPEAEKRQYLSDWSRPGVLTAMLNWYRAARLVVPPSDAEMPLPGWAARPFPRIATPTMVLWGMRDPALLPMQLEGLDALVADLTIARLPDAGHFAPWEAPDAVAAALRPFLAGGAAASARGQ